MVIKNQVIRYRKEIKQGDVYTIATTIIGYNNKVTHFLLSSILTHSLNHSLTHSLTYSLTYSIINTHL
jgi:hypothetical protein